MSMQKRALASSSSGQPSQPKRSCLHPVDEAWNGSETNPLLSCYLTKEDVRSVVREELEHAKSHSAEFQSCTGHALEDIAQLMHSLEYNVQKLKEALKLAGIHCPYLASCTGHGLEDIAQQMHSLEDAVQKLKEVLEFASIHSPHIVRANTNSTGRNDVRNLQLQLGTKLSLPLFTGNKLEGDGGGHIDVALIDVNTGEVVTSGLESSIKLDVVVLEGDFNKDDEDNWTQEEFENHVVKQREGKRPLLTGDLLVKLERGVGKL